MMKFRAAEILEKKEKKRECARVGLPWKWEGLRFGHCTRRGGKCAGSGCRFVIIYRPGKKGGPALAERSEVRSRPAPAQFRFAIATLGPVAGHSCPGIFFLEGVSFLFAARAYGRNVGLLKSSCVELFPAVCADKMKRNRSPPQPDQPEGGTEGGSFQTLLIGSVFGPGGERHIPF